MGVHGLWWGLVITNTLQGIVMTVVALRFDYAAESAKAAARVAAHHPNARPAAGSGGLRQPLLEGPQCGLLEEGALLSQQLDPAGPEEQDAPAAAAATPQRGRQSGRDG